MQFDFSFIGQFENASNELEIESTSLDIISNAYLELEILSLINWMAVSVGFVWFCRQIELLLQNKAAEYESSNKSLNISMKS